MFNRITNNTLSPLTNNTPSIVKRFLIATAQVIAGFAFVGSTGSLISYSAGLGLIPSSTAQLVYHLTLFIGSFIFLAYQYRQNAINFAYWITTTITELTHSFIDTIKFCVKNWLEITAGITLMTSGWVMLLASNNETTQSSHEQAIVATVVSLVYLVWRYINMELLTNIGNGIFDIGEVAGDFLEGTFIIILKLAAILLFLGLLGGLLFLVFTNFILALQIIVALWVVLFVYGVVSR